MKQSLSVLLAGTVDYAGLFPPAALDMRAAVDAYATYLTDAAREMLGRFVVPVARLREFDDAARNVLPRGEGVTPWRLSALTGPDVRVDIRQALEFNCAHWSGSELGHAEIDALEIRAQGTADIGSAMSTMPPQMTAFFEVPTATDPAALIAEIRRSGGRAKARTGGVTASAIPPTADIARFMIRCRDERVGFKLTAGLHHPMRGPYRLTYDENAASGEMFGYLGTLVAAVLAWNGMDQSVVQSALESTDPADFGFSDDALAFRGYEVPTPAVRAARADFVMSFGSCSFREPVDDLAALSFS